MQTVLRILNRDHAWSAVFFSVMFSIWVIYTDEVINSDGIRYIESARLFIEQGWSAGFNHYHWPFYTLLIVSLSKLLFIELETAAYVLNTILLGLLTFMFVRCARELGGDKKVTLAAAILLLTHVTLNEFRDLIVRDFGYLAFSFTAFYYLLKHKIIGANRDALAAGAAMVVATLFRVEGVVFLILGPLILLWQSIPLQKRLRSCLLVWMPAIILAVITMIGISLLSEGGGLVNNKLSESIWIINNTLLSASQGISDKARILEETVLNLQTRNMGTESVVAILIMIMLSDMMSATGVLKPALLVWGISKEHIRCKVKDWSIPVWLLVLNIVILTSFVVGRFFLVSRYALYFSLLVSVLAAFPLAELLRSKASSTDVRHLKKSRSVRVILIIMLIYMLGDGLTSSGDKAYIREAAQWLNINAKQSAIFSNEEHMYYYTRRFVPWETMKGTFDATRQSKIPMVDLTKYDYLIFKVGRKQKGFEESLKTWIGIEPTHITRNKRGDKILIFMMHS